MNPLTGLDSDLEPFQWIQTWNGMLLCNISFPPHSPHTQGIVQTREFGWSSKVNGMWDVIFWHGEERLEERKNQEMDFVILGLVSSVLASLLGSE